jgi:hypothetical protein
MRQPQFASQPAIQHVVQSASVIATQALQRIFDEVFMLEGTNTGKTKPSHQELQNNAVLAAALKRWSIPQVCSTTADRLAAILRVCQLT